MRPETESHSRCIQHPVHVYLFHTLECSSVSASELQVCPWLRLTSNQDQLSPDELVRQQFSHLRVDCVVNASLLVDQRIILRFGILLAIIGLLHETFHFTMEV